MAPTATPKVNLKDKVEDGEIDLSMADLQEVPVKEIAAVKKAHSLDLSNNHIVTIPKNFATLVNLIKLDLSKNQLKELPENFGDLTKLKHLDLYKNELQHLPLSFSKLKTLKWLDLKDNPLVPAIATVAGPCLENKQCQKCAKDIVAFYVHLQEKVEEERKVREAQRQKSLQANALKSKQEKKSKKDKKNKSKDSKGNSEISLKDKVSTISKGTNDTIHEDVKTGTSKKSLVSTVFSFIMRLFMFLTVLGIVLFILTAVKVKPLQGVEDHVTQMWNDRFIKVLPHSLQMYGMQVGKGVQHLHSVTGEGALTAIHYIVELNNNNIIFTELIAVATNATRSAREFYMKVFGN